MPVAGSPAASSNSTIDRHAARQLGRTGSTRRGGCRTARGRGSGRLGTRRPAPRLHVAARRARARVAQPDCRLRCRTAPGWPWCARTSGRRAAAGRWCRSHDRGSSGAVRSRSPGRQLSCDGPHRSVRHDTSPIGMCRSSSTTRVPAPLLQNPSPSNLSRSLRSELDRVAVGARPVVLTDCVPVGSHRRHP